MSANIHLRRVTTDAVVQEHYVALVHRFAKQFTDDTLLVDDSDDDHGILTAVSRYAPKQLIILVWLESYANSCLSKYLLGLLRQQGVSVKYHGYCENDFDFFSTVLDLETPPLPNLGARLFLSHNRRITQWHRVGLQNLILASGLDKQGHISWGDAPLDVRTLGDKDQYADHYITVVNETSAGTLGNRRAVSNPGGVFLTEKIWKPIVGLRPFMLNGDPEIINYLESQGFDTFSEFRPLGARSIAALHQNIIDSLTELGKYSAEQIRQRYMEDWLPRCRANKELYLDYRSRMLETFGSKR